MLTLLSSLVSFARAGVEVGSYGRVQAASDLAGGRAEPVSVVAHDTRLEKDPYLELDVVVEETAGDSRFEVVVTPALQGELFHYDGRWDADLALRNLYVEARGWTAAPVAVWAGSRMLRGDDVHLLDFWPLDEVNTVGGGASLEPGDWRLAAQVGLNRIAGDDWQVQEAEIPLEGGVGTEEVLVLDRQRTIATAKAGRLFGDDDLTFRVQAYGEMQRLPEGTRLVEDGMIEEDLPADRGSVAGVQLSAWGWARDSYAHLWVRRATGLGAYGSMAVPGDGLATDHTVAAAREHQVAFAGNTEGERAGLMVGAYVRRLADADGIEVDADDRWEACAALRPQLFPTDHTVLGLEVSRQWLHPDGLNPRTGEYAAPTVTKLAILPGVQPRPGGFSRPQVRLQYVLTWLDDDARTWFAEDDVRHDANVHHFLGVGAEWWVNSKSYR